MHKTANISPCGNWRYTLTRDWRDDDNPCMGFLMFNPSTADASEDDHTIRKCIGFAKEWGYGGIVVVNLFAIRGRDPKIVSRVADPVGPLNNYHIIKALNPCEQVIFAWGCSAHFPDRNKTRSGELKQLLEKELPALDIMCLGRSKDGSPRHPLMLPYTTGRERF